MMELGQFPHTPPSRMRATPSATSSTSSKVPSISSAGPTCVASAALTRDFNRSEVAETDTRHLLAWFVTSIIGNDSKHLPALLVYGLSTAFVLQLQQSRQDLG